MANYLHSISFKSQTSFICRKIDRLFPGRMKSKRNMPLVNRPIIAYTSMDPADHSGGIDIIPHNEGKLKKAIEIITGGQQNLPSPSSIDAFDMVIPDIAHTALGEAATTAAEELHGSLVEEAVHGATGHSIKGVVSHIAEAIHDFLT